VHFPAAYLPSQECEAVLDNDFFLTACKEEFVENARLFVFEVS
jgi:translation initiation factor 3 subunit E